MDIPTTPLELTASAAMIWTWAVDFLPRLGGAVLILALGLIAAKWAGRAIAGLSPRGVRLDETVRPVMAATVRYAIVILVLVAALSQLGVQTASILAVLGAAGLAIGLALQGTLSNIAAGLMLLWLRPFRVGEYVETPAVAGVVREIGLFVTQLDTFDGLYRFVPNSEIWNKPLVNHTRNPSRMANFVIGLALDADLGKAQTILRGSIAGEARVLSHPAAEVFLDSMTDNFAFLGVRAWLPAGGFWAAHRDLVAAIKERLEDAGMRVQRLIHPALDTGDSFRARPLAGPEARLTPTETVPRRAWRARNG